MQNLKKRKDSLTQIAVVVVSLLCALLVGAVFLLLEKEDPLQIYRTLFFQPFQSLSGVLKVLTRTTPLLLAGLAVALAFKCNIFNIGVEGQIYAGGLTAAALGYFMNGLPAWLHVLICILGAMAVGALLACIPAILKVRLQVHEVISTIMLNYIISSVIAWIVVQYFRYNGPVARTPEILPSARLHLLSAGEMLNSGLLIALVLCIVIWFVFERTSIGWRIDAAGKNLTAARYAGMNSNCLILMTMMASGAVAALVGVERVLGAYGYMELNFSPGYGWDGITIAVIAMNQPVGILLLSLLFGLMSYGGTLVNVMSGVPIEWVQVLNVLILIFVVMAQAVLKMWSYKKYEKRKGGKNK